MKIIADESLNYKFVTALRNEGYDVLSISEKHASIADKEILEMSVLAPAIVITEDKDFGELVFKLKKDFITVILLRYEINTLVHVLANLLSVLKNHNKDLYKCFVTIDQNRTRIRYI